MTNKTDMHEFGVDDVIARVCDAAFGKPLVTNVLRGQVAEAIVALALEPEWSWCSADYAGWDFERADGLRLEVKQSSVKQSWRTNGPSKAGFDIKPRTGYWEDGVTWVAKPGRAAHIYVFAHHHVYEDSADHRDPTQWDFYVVDTRNLPPTQRLGIPKLQKLTSAVTVAALKTKVHEVASRLEG